MRRPRSPLRGGVPLHSPLDTTAARGKRYLGGAESYFGGYASGTSGKHDMWHDQLPGKDIVGDIFYSANFYANTAVEKIQQHNKSKSLFLYLAIQNVHSPYQLPPAWEVQDFPRMWDHTYANMLHMLDQAVKNVTAALVAADMWDDTLLVFSADK